jgi:four helix bundle protein
MLEAGGSKLEKPHARTARNGWIQGYEDLEVFQRAMRLVKPVNTLLLRFPEYERFVLSDQMRRASRSIPTNIAEGYAKKKYIKSFKSSLVDAMGSATEMKVHFRIAFELEYVTEEEYALFSEEYDIIGRQLNRLIANWRTLENPPTPNVQPRGGAA